MNGDANTRWPLPDGPLKICSYTYLEKQGITASRSTLGRWEKRGLFPTSNA